MLDQSFDLSTCDRLSHIHAHANLDALASTGPEIMVSGQGVTVTDVAGRTYIDALSGMWCVGLGYGDPRLITAVASQMQRLAYWPVFGPRTSDTAVRLAARLAEICPGDLSHAFFVNSGSEANDTALKMVWYYNNALGRPKKKRIVTFDRAYHGSTVGAASLTALPHMHQSFDLPVADVIRVPSPRPGMSVEALFGEIEAAVAAAGPETIAAFFVEPVQGAGGVLIPPEGFYRRLATFLKRQGILLVADEIITGFGRTGAMFGCERFDFQPDLMTLAKNLSSGYMPIGAVMVSTPIYDVLRRASADIGTFACGMTYSGHPAACAIALECLTRYTAPGFIERVNVLGARLQARLSEVAQRREVQSVRSVGLLGAIDLKRREAAEAPIGASGRRVVAAGLRQGVILRALGDTIVICPPFVCTEADIDLISERFVHALDEVADDAS